MVILDLDDFAESNLGESRLFTLYDKIPKIKLNLFTIPGLCSGKFLESIRKLDWIRMYPHGWFHETSRECENWSYNQAQAYLRSMENNGWQTLFKAPGWNLSEEFYQALLDRTWSLADHPKNKNRRPMGLRVYDWTEYPGEAIHGHIGHMGSHNDNELEYIYDEILSRKEEDFKFIEEVLDVDHNLTKSNGDE